MKKSLSLTVEENMYQEVKQMIPAGKISSLVNHLLSRYLEREKKKN